MPGQNIPKNHHWIPQFYLKYFSPDPKAAPPCIFVTDKASAYETGHLSSKERRIRRVASLLHLYNKVAPDGQINPFLELRFGEIEDEASKVWRRLYEGAPIDIARGGKDRAVIAKFLAAQHLRVPRMISVAEHAIRSGLPDIDLDEMNDSALDDFYSRIGSIEPALGPTEQDMSERANFREMISKNLDKLQEILLNMTWSIIVFDVPDLITSDSPVYVIHGQTLSPWALGQPESVTYYPMTRNHLLLLTGSQISGPKDGNISSGKSDIMKAINGMTLHFSVSQVYSAVDLEGKFEVLR